MTKKTFWILGGMIVLVHVVAFATVLVTVRQLQQHEALNKDASWFSIYSAAVAVVWWSCGALLWRRWYAVLLLFWMLWCPLLFMVLILGRVTGLGAFW
jgi:hypothetical protein